MRIVLTGAGGFVGRHVLTELAGHDIVATDLSLKTVHDAPNITKIEGDLREPSTLEEAFKRGCDAVIHLATVPGGAAEADPILAKSVNIDATMALIDMASKTGNCPRFVFASSIAVFGKLPIAQVNDDIPAAPTMIYGGQKLMMEDWIATQSRRGAIEGISLRLPGVVARPKSPSGMKSAFLSDLFHALRENENFTMPVSRDATSWLCSISIAAMNLSKAALSEFDVPSDYSPILAPALCVKMKTLEQEIRQQLGTSSANISYAPDEALQSVFGEHPDVKTHKAQKLGLIADGNLKYLVESALKKNTKTEKTND